MKFAFHCFIAILTVLSGINMATVTDNVTTHPTNPSVDTVFSATVKTRTHAETVQKLNTNDSNVTDTSNNDTIDNGYTLINVTLSEFDNSTEENDNEEHDIHSSFNLAIIPAVAVFVFIVISCIKCCKWFRHYTRGGNKDENYYAVIVTDEDKDYGQIDILSESASTACYDTVSSYTSFLKRSGNDSTLNSIRTLRQDGRNDQSVTSQSSNDFMCRTTRTEVKSSRDQNCKSLNSCTQKKKDVAQGSCDIRTSSTSSTDTVSEQLTDSPIVRRNNRFRVSFVTEKPTKLSTSENKLSNNNVKNEKAIRSSLKKPSAMEIKRLDETKMQDAASQSGSTGKTDESVAMVDVGTQTNKSFRYSLRKSKGHVSDSDINERMFLKPNTKMLSLQTEESQNLHDNVVKRNRDRHISAAKCVKHSSLSQEEGSEPLISTFMSEISKYPFDTNVEVIHNRNVVKDFGEDFEDDVFVKEEVTQCKHNLDTEKISSINNLSQSCGNAKTNIKENVHESFSEKDVLFCVNCKPNIDQNIVEPFCDKALTQVAKTETVIPTYCTKCKLIHKDKHKDPCETKMVHKDKHKDSCETKMVHKDKHKESSEVENNATEEFLVEDECRFTAEYPAECNERPSSSLSLESSGYAELSFTDSSSSTN